MSRLRLSPSILTADFTRLGEEIESVTPYIDWFHLDVMDGHYVDNLTFGPSVVEAVRRSCDLPLHVHLMISEPAKHARAFVEAGATRLSFHPEVVEDPAEVIGLIAGLGAEAGLAVHPDSSLDFVSKHVAEIEGVLMMTVRPGFGGQALLEHVVPNIERAREIVTASGRAMDVEVDGGIKLSNVDRVVSSGGEIIVAGSAVFDGVDAPAAAAGLRRRLDELEGEDGRSA